MTKEKAKHLAEVLNACAEGKTIEVFLDNKWCEVPADLFYLNVEKGSYRIKKEPKYRPFRSAKECLDEMSKHKPAGWLRWNKVFTHITEIRPSGIEINKEFYLFGELLHRKGTFADGQPFGIKE